MTFQAGVTQKILQAPNIMRFVLLGGWRENLLDIVSCPDSTLSKLYLPNLFR